GRLGAVGVDGELVDGDDLGQPVFELTYPGPNSQAHRRSPHPAERVGELVGRASGGDQGEDVALVGEGAAGELRLLEVVELALELDDDMVGLYRRRRRTQILQLSHLPGALPTGVLDVDGD